MSVADQIVAEAQRQGVDPALAIELATQESGLNPNVGDGAAGEIGIFQILPSTAPGVNLRDLATNIQTGIGILRQLLNVFGDPTAAVAAYNCGQTCVQMAMAHWGSSWFAHIPSSTQHYASSIISRVQTAYTPSFSPPSPFAVPITAGFSPLDLAAQQQGMSLWTKAAIALAVIFGVSLLLSDI